MKQKYLIPIIAVLAVIVLVVCVLIFFKKPADGGYVDVRVRTSDEITLDLGRYKGEIVNGVEYFEARLEDIDAFIDDVKKSPYFDEKLYFDVGENHYWKQYFYLIFENRIFLLNVSENHIELRPVEELYCRSALSKTPDEPPDQLALVYSRPLNYDEKTDRYLPSKWHQDTATFESLVYLYQKLDGMAKIEDGKIYLRGLELYFDDLNNEIKSRPLDYIFMIYQGENGEIMASHLY